MLPKAVTRGKHMPEHKGLLTSKNVAIRLWPDESDISTDSSGASSRGQTHVKTQTEYRYR